ncbi:Glycosyltransferase LARGE1 [Labeo rohita]|uniref:Glycosyltransferase LARGE1 n=1 Tax=Labeo rohita TaxID=84645 RepID=A0A498LQH4_LABRO|nr:Glycosyltransferase LARGE1 [Labeo rohita]RXN19654.1 Glycosyltransferase LARGE1 [Labeo rohita]
MALSNPGACAHCRQLRRSTLDRHVAFVERVLGGAVASHGPLLSSDADPEAALAVFGEAAGSWGDRVEAEEAGGIPLMAPEFGREFCCRDDDSVSLDAGEEFSDDAFQAGQIPVSPSFSEAAGGSEAGEDPFMDLYRRAAEKLSVEWPVPPPVQKSSRFGGFYLSPVQTVVRTRLPLYPDCVAELTSLWPKPMSPPPPVPGASRFTELEGAGEAGLVSAPPMEHSLAAYLAPTQNSGIAGTPTLPTGPYRFSFKQLGRIYGEQACAARALSSMSLLQTYQAICLGELSEAVSAGRPCDALMGEVLSTADYILRATRGALVSLGHAMAGTVVAQRHLWLTLANLPERDRSAFLSTPISPSGFFGAGLGAVQALFEDSKKQAESLRGSMPRRFSRPAQPAARPGPRLSSRPPPAKRPASATASRPAAWGSGGPRMHSKHREASGRKGPPAAKGGHPSGGKKGQSGP